MNKTKLISSLGSAIAASLLTTPLVQAGENPFALQKVTNPTHLAEMDKGAEGKCGEGKCGDKKMKEGGCNGTVEKSAEGKCSEGKCGDKMKEGGCNGSIDEPATEQ